MTKGILFRCLLIWSFSVLFFTFTLYLKKSIAGDDIGLLREDFKKVCENGFGDQRNSYAWSMAWFKGRLYVGTVRDYLCIAEFLRSDYPEEGYGNSIVECDLSPLDAPEEFSAEIWRYTPGIGWDRVYKSPLISVTLKDRKTLVIPREVGYRGMVVHTDVHGEEALYIGTLSFPGYANILRTTDGISFTPTNPTVPKGPLAFLGTYSFRNLISFNGKLYTTPSSIKIGNVLGIVKVFESAEPASGIWQPVSTGRFGCFENETVFELTVFNNYLYAGTGNSKTGFQIWKTDAIGNPLYNWEIVVANGAGRCYKNESPVSMYPFNGYLYIGTGIRQYAKIEEKWLPPPAEIIRIAPDDSIELVVGEERKVMDTLISPISGYAAGFGNPFTGYIWRMQEYDGWLYVSTFDTTIFLSGLAKEVKPAFLGDWIFDFIEKEGGFDLWKTKDGVNWTQIAKDGFNNKFNYGIRTFASTPLGLFVGTANPFKDNNLHDSEPIEGGLEIWLGSFFEPFH
ncbi:MAG: hypothetical protein SV062_14965 [Thermodesulfobacteriota bacterium]|nr:hypothetical protein [Thermodesulfobacteriota bacterium]